MVSPVDCCFVDISFLMLCTVTQAAIKIGTYNAFVARAEELDLPSAVEAHPILNVREYFSFVLTQSHAVLIREKPSCKS